MISIVKPQRTQRRELERGRGEDGRRGRLEDGK